jgi:purine-binding chemotaxis protein CheW
MMNGKETQLITFKLGDEEFGVEISQVREIVRMMDITHIPNASDFVEGIINIRGRIATIIDLRKKFGLPSKDVDQETRIIIVELDDDIIGMRVDSVIEVKRISDADIESVPPMIATGAPTQYLIGVAKLPEELLILIDLRKVLGEEYGTET